MRAFIRPRLSAAVAVAVFSTLLSAGCSRVLSDAIKQLTSKYTVGGTVTGLSGSDLVLEDNGSDDLAVSSDGAFTFATALMTGQSYTVTVKTQPSNPAQTCTVSNASGAVASENISNVAVSCTNNATPAITSVGTPLATPPSSQVIDAMGGSIASADGRMTVTVPAGAVAGATTFTIQPITNQAPGGVGNAYRLGPAGETFSTPVSISLHYSSTDLAGTVADALSLAYQDTQGRWDVYKSVTLDTTEQTVTVSSSHFSDWALLAGESLEPAAARIGTGQTQTLTLVWCQEIDFGDPLIQYAAVCQPIGDASSWSVNSVPGGNNNVGTVSTGDSSAIYTAPGTIPAANPVAVSVEALLAPLGKTQELFVSNITIGGCSASNAQNCIWTGTSSTEDTHWKATAQVTWKWLENDPGNPNVARYVPETGSVTLTDLQPNCSVDGAAQAITSAPPSELTIDYSTTPPTVSGNGTNPTGWTETCNPPQNPPLKPGAIWWIDLGSPMSADGLTIEGSTNVGGVSTSWNFTAN